MTHGFLYFKCLPVYSKFNRVLFCCTFTPPINIPPIKPERGKLTAYGQSLTTKNKGCLGQLFIYKMKHLTRMSQHIIKFINSN